MIRTLALDNYFPKRSAKATADRVSNDTPLTFESIYEKYGARILNLAFRMVAKEEDARDLTQEVFIKVYENLHTFKHESQLYTWIYRIAVNHILNFLKKERRHTWINLMDQDVSEVFRDEEIDARAWTASSAPPAVDRKLEKRERMQIVWSMVQTLPAKYRVPLVLHHYEGLSYKDIADAMDLSMSAVESRIHRAKRQLIKKLEPWVEKL